MTDLPYFEIASAMARAEAHKLAVKREESAEGYREPHFEDPDEGYELEVQAEMDGRP